MIATTYCRKSNLDKMKKKDKEEDRSVEQQRQENVTVAAARGDTIPPEWVFTDDGKSGALFAKGQRPGFDALMAAGDVASPPFQVLYIWKVDRFAREDIDGAYHLKRLVQRGITIIETRDGGMGEVIDPASLLYRIKNVVAAEYRKLVGEDVRRALKQKVLRGRAVGGAAYGYRIQDPDKMLVREDAKAESVQTVHTIFRLKAEYRSYLTIARTLTSQGVLSPLGKPTWSPSTVRQILHNRLYLGQVIWGKATGKDQFGQPAPLSLRKRPETEWITRRDDALQIIDDLTWERAHRTIRPGLGGTGRPPADTSPYLLSGLVECALCGATYIGWNRGTGRTRVYRCKSRHHLGRPGCANGVAPATEVLDRAVIDALLKDVLDSEENQEWIIEEAARLIAQDYTQDDPSKALRNEVAQAEQELSRLSEAVAKIGPDGALLAKITATRDRLATLKAQVKKAPQRKALDAYLIERIKDSIAATITGWREMFLENPQAHRTGLRELLTRKIRVTPGQDAQGRFLRLDGLADGWALLRSDLPGSRSTTKSAKSTSIKSKSAWPESVQRPLIRGLA